MPILGQMNTATATGQKLGIDLSAIAPRLINPTETPLLNRINKIAQTKPAIKHEWQDRNILAQGSTVGAAGATNVATSVPVAAGTAKYFKPGYVLDAKNGGEQFLVTAVNTATDVLTVVRDYGVTNVTGVALASGDALSRVGYALQDGAPLQAPTSNGFNQLYNYITILQEQVSISDLELAVAVYGETDKFARQLQDQMTSMNISLEKSLFVGRRYDDGAGTRTMGGIETFVTTNKFSAFGAISESAIDAKLQAIYDAGGTTDFLVMPSALALKFAGFFKDATSNVRRELMADSGKGLGVGYAVKTYTSQFGTHEIILDRFCPAGSIYGLEAASLALVNMKAPTFTPTAKTQSATNGFVEQWVTLELSTESHNLVLKGAS